MITIILIYAISGIITGKITMSAPKAKKDHMFDGNQATTTAASDTPPKSNNQYQSKFDNLHHPLIVLDTSVILEAIGFNEDKVQSERTYAFLVQNQERIKVPEVAEYEANQKLKYREEDTSEMLKKMKLFEGKVVDNSHNAIQDVNKILAYARNNVDSKIAENWLRLKENYLEEKHKELFDTEWGSYTMRIQEQLNRLYGDAEIDMKIMAEALVLAEQEDVILISNDSDFAVFGDELSNHAKHRLQVWDISSILACESEETTK